MYVVNEILYLSGEVTNDVLTIDGQVTDKLLIVDTPMYKERMMSYYPTVIRSIMEFQAIINIEYPHIERLAKESEKVLADAYLTTMGERRITQWENALGIIPIKDSSVEDRRETIIARIRGQGKLNTALINSIVNAFTGGTATSWVDDSVLYVEITPPPNNKQYKFENVERELKKKVPAHLGFKVSRNYYSWNEIKNTKSTWQDVKDEFNNWEEVYLFVPFS